MFTLSEDVQLTMIHSALKPFCYIVHTLMLIYLQSISSTSSSSIAINLGDGAFG